MCTAEKRQALDAWALVVDAIVSGASEKKLEEIRKRMRVQVYRVNLRGNSARKSCPHYEEWLKSIEKAVSGEPALNVVEPCQGEGVTVSEGQKVEPAVSFIHLIKRRELKQRILEAVTKAQEKSPPGTGALIVESQRRNFVKSFDAIENCQQREIFDAIETAFQLGKYAETVDIVTEKKVKRADDDHHADAEYTRRSSKAAQTYVREVVRAALRMNPQR